ncbi:uncharacterized protein LOC112554486 [Pomacea canaliculata]|uniref:uncharacterized protein LOC112554486 n=1 Tax=Pomacea canaliculata TaxID=400727 RepID=UPI000D735031|nr:uncharacterized protein LOC112554486 [Pomacea canaliculata]
MPRSSTSTTVATSPYGTQRQVRLSLHLVVSRPEVFARPDRVCFLYLLCCKAIDLDAVDSSGDTALHKVVRYSGAYRMIVCLLRCGADPEIRNRDGKTPEEILQTEQPDGWEENLHWLRKFLPGIWRAVLADDPDLHLVECLLKSWCRLSKCVGGDYASLKCKAHGRECSLNVILLLEKYENTIELALAMLAGKDNVIRHWREEGIIRSIDINTKDYSYQYSYRDYPTAPLPLLASVWETNSYSMVSEFLSLGPDTNVPFKFEPEAHHMMKPLFFYLIHPKLKPPDERIVCCILMRSDLGARNTLGQTILFEAVQHDVSEKLFRFLLEQGCNVAARDRYGRTVRDYCDELGKTSYITLVDEYVASLVADCNISLLEKLILQGYDRVTDLKASHDGKTFGGQESKQLNELLAEAGKKQKKVKEMFEAVIGGCLLKSRRVVTRKLACAQDRGGRTVLHHAVEKSHRNLVEYIVGEFPQIINIPNNMGQTPLHYAYLFMHKDDTPEYLINKGANKEAKDVEGWVPSDYVRETQKVRDLELDVFLSGTNFDAAFYEAIREGALKRVEALAIRLRDHGGMRRFSRALFECLDHGHEDIACMLIKLGFNTDSYKEYVMCDPDDPMCSMMECSHSTTSFRQQAELVRASKVLQLMDDIAGGKVKVQSRSSCMGRCLRPTLTADSAK